MTKEVQCLRRRDVFRKPVSRGAEKRQLYAAHLSTTAHTWLTNTVRMQRTGFHSRETMVACRKSVFNRNRVCDSRGRKLYFEDSAISHDHDSRKFHSDPNALQEARRRHPRRRLLESGGDYATVAHRRSRGDTSGKNLPPGEDIEVRPVGSLEELSDALPESGAAGYFGSSTFQIMLDCLGERLCE